MASSLPELLSPHRARAQRSPARAVPRPEQTAHGGFTPSSTRPGQRAGPQQPPRPRPAGATSSPGSCWSQATPAAEVSAVLGGGSTQGHPPGQGTFCSVSRLPQVSALRGTPWVKDPQHRDAQPWW